MQTFRTLITSHCALLAVLFTLTFAPAASPQKYKLVFDPETPAGQHLELIELQTDEAKRLPLVEQFVERFPQHPAAAWAYERMMQVYWLAGRYDRVIAAGEKLLQIHKHDLDAAQWCLKAAQARKDAVQIKIWTDFTQRLADLIVKAPSPKDPLEQEAWKSMVQSASHHLAQGDYELYRKALKETDLRTRLRYLDELIKQNPASDYLPQAQVLAFQAYRALGETRLAAAAAEKVLQYEPSNEDALLAAADAHSQRHSSAASTYASKLLQVMQTKQRPEGAREQDWARKKSLYTGNAYWIIGNAQLNENRFAAADQSLRVALHYLQGDQASEAPLLFYLGWANYKLENYPEAMRFFKRCAALHGQYQEQAVRNIQVIRNEHGVEN